MGHLYGMPAKIDETTVCQSHEIPLIEDAAEALGASYKGKMPRIWDYSIMSFNGNKIITTRWRCLALE